MISPTYFRFYSTTTGSIVVFSPALFVTVLPPCESWLPLSSCHILSVLGKFHSAQCVFHWHSFLLPFPPLFVDTHLICLALLWTECCASLRIHMLKP